MLGTLDRITREVTVHASSGGTCIRYKGCSWFWPLVLSAMTRVVMAVVSDDLIKGLSFVGHSLRKHTQE